MNDLVKTVDVETARVWLTNEEAVLIDVREPDEFALKSVTGSILCPLSTFEAKGLSCPPGKKVIFICRSGARSARACFFFSQEFPEIDAYNLEGGILAWG